LQLLSLFLSKYFQFDLKKITFGVLTLAIAVLDEIESVAAYVLEQAANDWKL